MNTSDADNDATGELANSEESADDLFDGDEFDIAFTEMKRNIANSAFRGWSGSPE